MSILLVRAENNPAIKSLFVLEAPVLEICPEEFESQTFFIFPIHPF